MRDAKRQHESTLANVVLPPVIGSRAQMDENCGPSEVGLGRHKKNVKRTTPLKMGQISPCGQSLLVYLSIVCIITTAATTCYCHCHNHGPTDSGSDLASSSSASPLAPPLLAMPVAAAAALVSSEPTSQQQSSPSWSLLASGDEYPTGNSGAPGDFSSLPDYVIDDDDQSSVLFYPAGAGIGGGGLSVAESGEQRPLPTIGAEPMNIIATNLADPLAAESSAFAAAAGPSEQLTMISSDGPRSESGGAKQQKRRQAPFEFAPSSNSLLQVADEFPYDNRYQQQQLVAPRVATTSQDGPSQEYLSAIEAMSLINQQQQQASPSTSKLQLPASAGQDKQANDNQREQPLPANQKVGPQFIREPPSFIHYLNSTDLVIPCAASGNPAPSIVSFTPDEKERGFRADTTRRMASTTSNRGA